MNENEIKRYFKIIDYGIKVFNADKGFKVDNKPYSDWLVFEQRTMKRNKNDLNYVIQIYPNFDEREEITAWTLYGSVWYDTDKNRYLADFSPASKVQLKQIALNIAELLKDTYNVISNIAKNEIPLATELS